MSEVLNGLDLFSGGGGLAEGLHHWVRPVAYCEIERGAQRVLLSRMARGELYSAPIWDDVRTLRGRSLPVVDIIAGGFPCQDISVAGAGAGLEGRRSGLVFEFLRLIGECRPQFVFMENVAALAIRGLDRVLLGLNALGYDARWTIVSAAEVGAPHLRERIWILAHANGHALRLKSKSERGGIGSAEFGRDGETRSFTDSAGKRLQSRRIQIGTESRQSKPSNHRKTTMAYAGCEGRQRWVDAAGAWQILALGSGSGSESWPCWLPQPGLRRGDDGLADRVNRLRILGNGVVPLCAEEAFMRLMGLDPDAAGATAKIE